MDDTQRYTVFAGERQVASGSLREVLLRAKAHLEKAPDARLLFFEDDTGRQVDFDLRGTPEQVLARALPVRKHAGPGRPKLGVASREVTLLPRHWEWLERQPSGISAALRRLVEEARRRESGEGKLRAAREAASRFMWAMAGDLPGFEEASRALFAGDAKRFRARIRRWPVDLRRYLERTIPDALLSASSSTARR